MTDEEEQDATQEYPTVDELDSEHRELLDPQPVRHAMIQAEPAGSGAGGQEL